MKVETVDDDEVAVISSLEGRPEVTLILMNEGENEELVSYVSVFVNGEYILEVEIPKGAGDFCYRVGENRVMDESDTELLADDAKEGVVGSLACDWNEGDRLLTSGEGSGVAVATPAMKRRNPDWDVPPYD
jgi:hypothetical protein